MLGCVPASGNIIRRYSAFIAKGIKTTQQPIKKSPCNFSGIRLCVEDNNKVQKSADHENFDWVQKLDLDSLQMDQKKIREISATLENLLQKISKTGGNQNFENGTIFEDLTKIKQELLTLQNNQAFRPDTQQIHDLLQLTRQYSQEITELNQQLQKQKNKVAETQQDLYKLLKIMKYNQEYITRYNSLPPDEDPKQQLFQVWIKNMQILKRQNENSYILVTFGIAGVDFQEFIVTLSTDLILTYCSHYDRQALDEMFKNHYEQYYQQYNDEDEDDPEFNPGASEEEYINDMLDFCKSRFNLQTDYFSWVGRRCYEDWRFTRIIFGFYYFNMYVGEIEVNKENGQIEKSKKKFSYCLWEAIWEDYPIYVAVSPDELGGIKEKQKNQKANQIKDIILVYATQTAKTEQIDINQTTQQQQLATNQLLRQIHCLTFYLIQLRSIFENQTIFQETLNSNNYKYKGCGFDMDEHYQVWIKDLNFNDSQDLEVIFGVANADFPECTIPLSKETLELVKWVDFEIYSIPEYKYLEMIHDHWKSLTKSEQYYSFYKGFKPDPFAKDPLQRYRQKNYPERYRDDCFVRYVLPHGNYAHVVQKQSLIDGQFDVRFCRLSKCVYDAILTLCPVYFAKSFIQRYASNLDD
eukprot:TRINITY_DN3120_c0_g1_i2.p1 TRINITY_DN3120_c0_g1~~TRINITY_DN3120_c0_g1_i2.p1  ORF type:complete len:637 (-),score=40.93 TRINITY_DN3120_c0_g1_i2:60-1970(-)